MSKDNFSIIVPAYNSEKYLKECLNSIYHFNSVKDFELIIINDKSNDNTNKIISKFKKKYTNIVYIRNKKNLGVAESRNIGIKKSKNKYIIFVDSDDYVNKNLIKIIKNKNYDLIISRNYNSVIANKKKIRRKLYKNIRKVKKNTQLINFFNKNYAANECWNYIYKRDFLVRNEILFSKKISIAEDQEFICKVILHSNTFSFNRINFYNNRIASGNLSHNFSIKNAKSLLKTFLNLYKLYLISNNNQKNFLIKRIDTPYREFIPFALTFKKKEQIKNFKNIIKKAKFNIASRNNKVHKQFYDLLFHYNSFLKAINKKFLDQIINFRKKDFFLFGLNIYSKMMFLYFKKKDYSCLGIIDNNVNFFDKKLIKKFKIKNIDILKKKNNSKILICNQDKQNVLNIKKQLNSFGMKNYNIKKIIFQIKKTSY